MNQKKEGRSPVSTKLADVFFKTLFLVGFVFLSTFILFSCQKSEKPSLLKVGLPEEPRSLNVWLGTDANSRRILSLIYQPLYTRHPETLDIIPWLAEKDPVFDAKALTYTVKLRKAKWSDGSDFTSKDVVFTRKLFFDFKIPRYYSKWKTIKKLEAPDDHTLIFHLSKPSAIFLSRVLTAPIVSQKEWEQIASDALTKEKPLRSLQDHAIEKPLGTGPFMLDEHKEGAYIHMLKNPHFFGTGTTIAGHSLGPFVDSLLFKIYGTSDVAIMALKNGDVDYYWWDIQPGYIEDLKKQTMIDLFFNKKSALYYMGFNARKAPYNNRAFRQATATIIDKDFILTRILQNYGNPMHSIIPSGNRLWYNPNVKKYGQDMDPAQRVKTAVEILQQAGYSWETPPVNDAGDIIEPSALILPDGSQMKKMVILTPPADYDPKRAFAGTMIQEWLRKLGISAFARPMAFNSLLDTVKGKHQFDAFVLGYGKLNLDPDYLKAFFSSSNDKPRGWNMSGYKNPHYDKLAKAQRSLVDVNERKKLIWEMQEILMTDVPYIPLYNPHIIEAANNTRFTGWIEKVNGVGNIWSLCMVKPKQ